MAAYDLSGDDVFKHKAQDLGDRLMNAFSLPNGVPYPFVHLENKETSFPGWQRGNVILSEIALQIEFRFLSNISGNNVYADKAHHILEVLNELKPLHGLYPVYLDSNTLKPAGDKKFSFGGMGDSFYEYLLKAWIQGNRTDDMYRNMVGFSY